MQLLTPLPLGPRTAPNRIMFGPHVTNLGADDRSLTQRHVAYYERRARGGCGTIVVEGASAHTSDWPYERAPLAERCADGWSRIVGACRPHGALVIASLDHTGGQGSSAYSQAPLWAPSRVPEVNSREVPKWMEAGDIAAVVDDFSAAGKVAIDADVDGVEINGGQHSLVRQFLSGLTNQREDEWGQDRLRFARDVLGAVRSALGDDRVLGLRLSCDELAPWAGITPEMAPDMAAHLVACGVDYLVVTRGAIFSAEKTRPDFHEPTGFNIDVCRSVREAVDVPVILQGSVVEWGHAEWALGGFDDDPIGAALCDGVEMTRAQIADPDLSTKLAHDEADRIRPCTRCNQTCQVRDARNPIVTCVGEPSSGRETEDPDWYQAARHHRSVTVVGAGPAGLEVARVAAIRGHDVTIVEREQHAGGMARIAGPHQALVDWYEREIARLGVTIRYGRDSGDDLHADLGADVHGGVVVVQATGSQAGNISYEIADDALVVDIADVRSGAVDLPASGTIVVFDPIGGPIGVALAEELADRAVLVTQDNIAGNELARTGDLAPANTRLAQQGVRIERRTLLRSVSAGGVVLEDRYSGAQRTVQCAAVVDCGFRLPSDELPGVSIRVGDAVAPRTVYEAVLEARRAALTI
jgi:mycofactocin system FadH/OYE family oxidoreductase 1